MWHVQEIESITDCISSGRAQHLLVNDKKDRVLLVKTFLTDNETESLVKTASTYVLQCHGKYQGRLICDFVDVQQFIKPKEPRFESQLQLIAVIHRIASGMKVLASLGIQHGHLDLKNIFFDKTNCFHSAKLLYIDYQAEEAKNDDVRSFGVLVTKLMTCCLQRVSEELKVRLLDLVEKCDNGQVTFAAICKEIEDMVLKAWFPYDEKAGQFWLSRFGLNSHGVGSPAFCNAIVSEYEIEYKNVHPLRQFFRVCDMNEFSRLCLMLPGFGDDISKWLEEASHIISQEWFFPLADSTKATRVCTESGEGSYMVRPSQRGDAFAFSLYRYKKMHHRRILVVDGKYQLQVAEHMFFQQFRDEAVKEAIVTFVLIFRKTGWLHKDIVRHIAKLIYSSRKSLSWAKTPSFNSLTEIIQAMLHGHAIWKPAKTRHLTPNFLEDVFLFDDEF